MVWLRREPALRETRANESSCHSQGARPHEKWGVDHGTSWDAAGRVHGRRLPIVRSSPRKAREGTQFRGPLEVGDGWGTAEGRDFQPRDSARTKPIRTCALFDYSTRSCGMRTRFCRGANEPKRASRATTWKGCGMPKRTVISSRSNPFLRTCSASAPDRSRDENGANEANQGGLAATRPIEDAVDLGRRSACQGASRMVDIDHTARCSPSSIKTLADPRRFDFRLDHRISFPTFAHPAM